jgi:tetratricopeptide (TPR) repeat protein
VRSLGAWLHRVATNLALRRIRGEARRKQREAQFAGGEPAAANPSWDDTIELVDEAIAELPEPLRVAIVGYYLQDRPQSALADELGVSRQLVTHRVAKGLEQLRKSLRRKGVLVAPTALGTMLAESASAEAPPTLVASLGKTALAGVSKALAPHVVAAASLGGTGAMSGLLAMKAVVAIVAMMAVSAGLVATCEPSVTPIAPANEVAVAATVPIENGDPTAPSTAPDPAAPREDVAVAAYDLRMSGRLEEAKAMLLAALAKDPKNARLHFELARTAMHGLLPQDPVTDPKAADASIRASVKLAAKAIEKAVDAEPDNPRYRYWAGMIHMYGSTSNMHSVWRWPMMPGGMKKSLKQYEAALALDPDYHEARFEVAGLYDRLPAILGGSKKRAEAHITELEARDEVWAARAKSARNVVTENGTQRRVTDDERMAAYATLIEARPDDANLQESLAKECLRRYRSQPENADNLANLEEHIAKTLALDSSRTGILYEWGRALVANKDYAKAEEVARRYLATKPVAPLEARAMRLLSQICEAQGRTEEAARLGEAANALHPVASLPDLPEKELFGPPE